MLVMELLMLCISLAAGLYLTSCWSRAPRVPLRSYLLCSYSMLRRIDAVVCNTSHLMLCVSVSGDLVLSYTGWVLVSILLDSVVLSSLPLLHVGHAVLYTPLATGSTNAMRCAITNRVSH